MADKLQYSHRNGEWQKPTQTGYFAHRDSPNFEGTILEIVLRRGELEYMIDNDYDRSEPLPTGQYWGPITGAWNEVGNG